MGAGRAGPLATTRWDMASNIRTLTLSVHAEPLSLVPAAFLGLIFGFLLMYCPAPSANPLNDLLAREWPRTDFKRSIVDLDEIRMGGPQKDGIPAIDRPRFVSSATAANWISAREPVIALTLGEEARAYPVQVLIWHEIVNDTIGDTPVAVTFCPLCNAAIAFDRSVGGRVLDFGTTGKLRHSDLIMYDRQTESWWQQFTGTAIVGEYVGHQLTTLPASIIAFEDFRDAFPHGEVLSRDTGHERDYGRNPYRGYDRVGERPFLFRGQPDPRLPALARVLGLVVGDRAMAYALSALPAASPLNAQIEDTPIVVFSKGGSQAPLDAERIRSSRVVPSAAAFSRRLDERVLQFRRQGDVIVDDETGSEWDVLGRSVAGPLQGRRLTQIDAGVYFSFAWFAFHPSSSLYRDDDGANPPRPDQRQAGS